MRRLMTISGLVLLIATAAVAQTATEEVRAKDSITQGEFAQLVLENTLG